MIIATLFVLAAHAADDFDREPDAVKPPPPAAPVAPRPTVPDLFRASVPDDSSLTCPEFMDILKKTEPATVEEALSAIKSKRPKFLERTVFQYESRMPFDGASLLNPRAVVYGGDAKVVLNFTGHARQKFGGRMQVMCFRDEEARFEFFEVAFPKEDGPPPRVLSSVTEPQTAEPLKAAASEPPETSAALTPEEKLQKYVVIPNGRGVRECKNCHQTPARPNVDTAFLWPGSFGAADDQLRDRARPDTRNIYNSFESSMWARFQSTSSKNGRYRFVSQPLTRPNSDFTLKISYLNGRRIVGDLKRLGAKFTPHKYAFAKALLCAPKAERRTFQQITGETSFSATLPVLGGGASPEVKEIFLSAYYDQMQKERRIGDTLSDFSIPSPLPKEKFEDLRKYYRNLLDPKNELNLDMRLAGVDVDEVLQVTELKKVTDKLDLDIENWSMVLDGGYVHENGLGAEGRVALRLILERPFADEFLSGDKELLEAIGAREERENAGGDVGAANAKICKTIESRLARKVAGN